MTRGICPSCLRDDLHIVHDICPYCNFNDEYIDLMLSKKEVKDLIYMCVGYIEKFLDHDKDNSNLIKKLEASIT